MRMAYSLIDRLEPMPPDLPKYSLPEIERRWDVSSVPSLKGLPYREIEDRYFTGTRLRLRRIWTPGETPIYKLCKKYGPISNLTEPITNIYLTEPEFATFENIPAEVVRKRRYAIAGGSLDISEDGEARFEREFLSEDEAVSYIPPEFVGEER